MFTALLNENKMYNWTSKSLSWFLNKKVKYNVESTWQSFVKGPTKCMFEHIVRRRLVDDELPAPPTSSCYACLLTDCLDSPKFLHFSWRPSRALCVTSGHFDLKCTNYSQIYLGGAKNPRRPHLRYIWIRDVQPQLKALDLDGRGKSRRLETVGKIIFFGHFLLFLVCFVLRGISSSFQGKWIIFRRFHLQAPLFINGTSQNLLQVGLVTKHAKK